VIITNCHKIIDKSAHTIEQIEDIPIKICDIEFIPHRWSWVISGDSLNDSLGIIIARNRIFTVNGNNGFLTEITAAGVQIKTKLLYSSGSPPGDGTFFGLHLYRLSDLFRR